MELKSLLKVFLSKSIEWLRLHLIEKEKLWSIIKELCCLILGGWIIFHFVEEKVHKKTEGILNRIQDLIDQLNNITIQQKGIIDNELQLSKDSNDKLCKIEKKSKEQIDKIESSNRELQKIYDILKSQADKKTETALNNLGKNQELEIKENKKSNLSINRINLKTEKIEEVDVIKDTGLKLYTINDPEWQMITSNNKDENKKNLYGKKIRIELLNGKVITGILVDIYRDFDRSGKLIQYWRIKSEQSDNSISQNFIWQFQKNE